MPVSRRSRLSRWCAAAVLVISGCSGSGDHGSRAAPGRVVPWSGVVPQPVRPVHVAAAPACRAAQLSVVGPGLQLTPAGPGGTGTIELRNSGPQPCRLTGRPEVRIVGAPYVVAQRQQPLPAAPATFPDVRPPADTLLALAPGSSADIGVQWSNWCPPRPRKAGAAQVPPRAIRVTLAGRGGSLAVDYNAVPDCTTPGRPSTIGVRPFTPSPLPATQPWTTAKVTARIVPLGTALTGRRGQPARFAVRLGNESATTVAFATCPMFVEALEPSGGSEVHQLNCRAAHAIAPHGSETFAMRIAVPADAPRGKNGLFWELDPTGAQYPEATSALRVTG